MELINNFGIEPVLFVAQIVNFLIVFYILKKFAYKPILELLKNRENTIKQGLKDAKEAQILLENATEKEKEILRNAQSEVKKMLDQAKKERSELFVKSETSAKKRAQDIIAEAKMQIELQTHEAEKRLSKRITRLAIDFLQKSVSELFSEKEQDEILTRALKKLKKQAY